MGGVFAALAVCVFMGCAHGPRVAVGYDRKTGVREFETNDNRLEGSYWKHAVPHNLDVDASVARSPDGTEKIELTVVYNASGRVFDNDDRRLILKTDGTAMVRQPDFVADPSEWVTQQRMTGEIVSRSGTYFENATYEITKEELFSIAQARSVTVERLGSRSPTDWYFGEKNFRAFRQLVAKAYTGVEPR